LEQNDYSLEFFRQALDSARNATREEVYQIASKAISIIPDADTLLSIYRELIAIDNWWDFELTDPGSGFSRGILDPLGKWNH
jgi:hypothetical protein